MGIREEYSEHIVSVFIQKSKETLDISIWVKSETEAEKAQKELILLAKKSAKYIKRWSILVVDEKDIKIRKTGNKKMSTGVSAYFKGEYCLPPAKKKKSA